MSLAVGCALALGACGSSSNPGSGSTAGHGNSGIRFAGCMRAHGVPGFPDPSPGGGINITPGSGVDPASPAFRSAQSICSRFMPGPLGHGKPSESRKLALLALARCMRRNGVPTFPDPTATPPRPGRGAGIAFGAPGSFIAVPEALIQSPAFQQAAVACGFPGARGTGPKPAAPG